jgi:hypothetical protein
MKEVIKALVFFVITMAIFFVPILYKNHWSIYWGGKVVYLIKE